MGESSPKLEIENQENKSIEQKPVLEIKYKSGDASEEIASAIKEAWKKCNTLPTLPKICDALKKELDAKHNKGWMVFAGKHIIGVFTHITGTLYEFEYDKTIFIVFQTIFPN